MLQTRGQRLRRRISGGRVAVATASVVGLVLAACAGAPPRPGSEPVPTASRAPVVVSAGPDLPAVHIIATGGTISNTGDDERLTGGQIVAAVPGLEDVAAVTVEQFSNIPSGSMTPELWLGLARRVAATFAERPEVRGVVITHGTDTMEETAYFLDLVIGDPRPIILTGAMRNASRLSPDGAANLFNAARVAVDPRAAGRGAMLLLNDVALPARAATKRSTSRLEAFEAPGGGPIAVADPDSVVFLEPAPDRRPPLIDPGRTESLPRVDVVYTYAGADGALVDAAVAAGARGIVMASVGRGGLTPGQAEAADRALERGVVVVVSSRTMSGRVPVGDDARLAGGEAGKGVRFGAGDLTPQKARVLLMLALARDPDPQAVLDVFRSY